MTKYKDDGTPLWFLDVDGVINAFPNHSTDDVLHYQTCKASPNRWRGMTEEDKQDMLHQPGGLRRYKITYDPVIIEKIKDLHEAGTVRVVWLTTWGRGANGELCSNLGLPTLVSAGEPEYIHGGWSGAQLQHCDQWGVWWKWNKIREYLAQFPTTAKFVWTDDDLAVETRAFEWATNRNGLPIAADATTGLTVKDLTLIEEYLAI